MALSILCRMADKSVRAALVLGLATSFAALPSMAAEKPRTGSLVPGGGGSSMVQETGRIRSDERARPGNPAAARRAANEAHDTLRMFASCLVSGASTDRERRDMAAFLRTSPDDPAVKTRSDKIVRDNCLNGVGADSVLLRFPTSLLRGAIFRQLYINVGSRSPSPVSRQEISAVWSPGVGGTQAANQRFGDCIVAADKPAADKFVRAKVGSAQQDAALGNVMARMSGCLTQGLTLQMSRAVLDGVLAEALYRQATASEDTGLGNPAQQL